MDRPRSMIGTMFRSLFGMSRQPQKPKPEATKSEIKAEVEKLAKLHPALGTSRSFVLHKFSTQDGYAKWRGRFKGLSDVPILQFETEQHLFGGFASEIDGFLFSIGRRNTTALFGAGRIDSIPETVLVSAAAKKHGKFPEISGRVAKLRDGRTGRFGWKAQEASLRDFVLTACAVELGLHVPGRSQSKPPRSPDYKAPGHDLNQQQCDSLIQYVAELPSPIRASGTKQQEKLIAEGNRLFENVGCAACHTEKLGNVDGLYSDLLLHDMGPELADSGAYGSILPDLTEEQQLTQPLPSIEGMGFGSAPQSKTKRKGNLVGASRQEWRTPPLWGVRDSGPYLHDGRASTLEHAIALHGGEAAKTRARYFKLSQADRRKVLVMLNSLVAPGTADQ